VTKLARVVGDAVLPALSRWDPERAHDWGLSGLQCLAPFWPAPPARPALAVHRLGLAFAHPLGLAAGFDKNGDYLDALGALGFSHVELGTVTPRPQSGNPKPRMFRAPSAGGLVNRMGFNNKGVDHLVARLRRARYAGIRGVSIGKNADTPLERAPQDYLACLEKVYALADYVAVNVSSHNTARLRELQAPDGLSSIVTPLLESRTRLETRHGRRVPLLVKIAPDLDSPQISAMAASLRSLGIDGVIATNTTTDLSVLGPDWPPGRRGGLSGAPLHARSAAVIRQLRAELGGSFPIIGVGGIVDGGRAAATLQAGADLLQIYTGFAYRGPVLLEEILNAIQGH
jgi:dihydroorotate dehydrogenase